MSATDVGEMPEARRLPLLFFEQMTNDVERDVVLALAALACSHLNWLIGTDPSVKPSELSGAEIQARTVAGMEAYRERALALIDVGLSDALDIVQTLVERGEP